MLPIKLFAASYSGAVTTLELSHSHSQGYTLESIASSKACTPAPSWLTLDSLRNTLYCTGVTATSTGLLHSMSVQENGTLVAIDETPTPNQAANSAIYGHDQALGVAYYGGNAIGTYNFQNPQNITTIQITMFNISKPGPNPVQTVSHPHEIIPDPSGKYVLVPDLGADLIRIFNISPNNTLLPSYVLPVPTGSGPRHGVFVTTTSTTYFYILTQISNMLLSYAVTYNHNNTLSFSQIQQTNLLQRMNGSLITMGPTTQNASELHVSPDNRFLLASLRDDNSFTIPSPLNSSQTITSDTLLSYEIDAGTGKVELVDEAAAGGATPRQFALNKKGDLVAVAVQNDGWVVVLERDCRSGKLGGSVGVVAGLGKGAQTGVICVIWDE